MELAVVVLLALLNLQFAALWFVSRPEKSEPEPVPEPAPVLAQEPAPEPAPKPVHPAAAERDARVHALIQKADPDWQPGDSRAHIELVPDKHTGEIVKAVRRGA